MARADGQVSADVSTLAGELRAAEDRLRALGLTGRGAFAALSRDLARRLGLPEDLWPDGEDAPPEAGLERIPLVHGVDLFGLAYERFFPDLFKGARGQFFTPEPVVRLLLGLAGVAVGEQVLDPTCGSGAFLVAAGRRGASVSGIELDPDLVALSRLNLALAGLEPGRVVRGDLFRATPGEPVDVILANPPFSVEVSDPRALAASGIARGRARVSSDVLFLEAAWRRLRPGGRLAAVLPHSLLESPRLAQVREWLLQRFARRAIVTLPEGVFRPFGGAAGRAAAVVLQRLPAAPRDWIAASVLDPGYETHRRSYVPTGSDEIPDLLRAVADGRAPVASAARVAWTPPALDGVLPGVRPLGLLTDLLERVPRSTVRPEEAPTDLWTEVDLADVDKDTGEVRTTRTLPGASFSGVKTAFEEGDLLFGRIRPSLGNVAIVQRTDPHAPERMCGSAEWVRFRAHEHPYFGLLALRSRFVRSQLRGTGGQTRPRVRARDLDAVAVPVPPDRLRARLDAVVGRAHTVRLHARRQLDAAARAYEDWGSGRLDDAGLAAVLDALESDMG